MKSLVGRQFMRIFDGFYYSFSPRVEKVIAESPLLQGTVRLLILPLIASLYTTATILTFLPHSSQFTAVVAGITASALIGTVYGSPFLVCSKLLRREKWEGQP